MPRGGSHAIRREPGDAGPRTAAEERKELLASLQLLALHIQLARLAPHTLQRLP